MENLWILQLRDEKEQSLSDTEICFNEITYEVYGALNENVQDTSFQKAGKDDEATLIEYTYTIPSEVIIALNNKNFYSIVYTDDTKAEHEFTKWLIRFKVTKANIKNSKDDNQYILEPAEILYFEYHRTSSERVSYLEELIKYFNGYYKYSSNFYDKINIEGEEAKEIIENKILKDKKMKFSIKPVENL